MLLGLTKKKLAIGAGAAVVAYLLWRKLRPNKTPPAGAGFRPGDIATTITDWLGRAVEALPKTPTLGFQGETSTGETASEGDISEPGDWDW